MFNYLHKGLSLVQKLKIAGIIGATVLTAILIISVIPVEAHSSLAHIHVILDAVNNILALLYDSTFGLQAIKTSTDDIQNQLNIIDDKIDAIGSPSPPPTTNPCDSLSNATTQLLAVDATPSNPTVNTQSDYEVMFALETADVDVHSVEMYWPCGFDLSNAQMLNVRTFYTGFPSGTLIASGQTLIWDHDPALRPACCVLVIMTIGGIVNGSTLNNQIAVATKDINGAIIDGPTLTTFELV